MLDDTPRSMWHLTMWVGVVVTGVMIALVIMYSLHMSFNVPRSDAWYFIHMIVRPLHEGTFAITNLVTVRDPSLGINLWYKLFLALNYELFQLDYALESSVAALAHVVLGVLITVSYIKNAPDSALIIKLAGVCSVLLALFSMNSYTQYTWSLLGFNYVYVSVGLWLFMLLDGWVKGKDQHVYILAIAALLISSGANMGDLLVVSAVIFSLFYAVKSRERVKIQFAVLFFIAVLISIWVRSNLTLSVTTDMPGMMERASDILGDLDLMIVALFRAIAQGVVTIEILEKVKCCEPKWLSFYLGMSIAVIQLTTLYYYLKNKHSQKNSVPVMLMIVPYLAILGIVVKRVPTFGEETIFSPRYVFMFQLSLVSWIWMMGYILGAKHRLKFVKIHLPSISIIGAVFFCMILLQSVYLNRAFHTAPYISAFYQKIRTDIKEAAEKHKSGIPVEITYCQHADCQRNSAFLKAAKLSFFAK